MIIRLKSVKEVWRPHGKTNSVQFYQLDMKSLLVHCMYTSGKKP